MQQQFRKETLEEEDLMTKVSAVATCSDILLHMPMCGNAFEIKMLQSLLDSFRSIPEETFFKERFYLHISLLTWGGVSSEKIIYKSLFFIGFSCLARELCSNCSHEL